MPAGIGYSAPGSPAAPGLDALIAALSLGGQPNGNLSNVQGILAGLGSPAIPQNPVDTRPQAPVSPFLQLIQSGLRGSNVGS